MLGTLLTLWSFFAFFQIINADGNWSKTKKDIRMPLELRVVNEGLAHHDNGWILSNQHFLYKTTTDPMEILLANHDAVTEELRSLSYDHIGDIDVVDGIIYGGLEARENTNNAVLATWNVTDLQMIRYKITTETYHMPWVAVDPSSKLIYSAIWNDCCELKIYNADTFEFVDNLTVNNLPGEIQGGAFYEGSLYICSNSGDDIWRINVQSGEVEFILSDLYNRSVYPEYEMEGLDFWDLSNRGLGVMHMFGNFMEGREKAVHNYDPPSLPP